VTGGACVVGPSAWVVVGADVDGTGGIVACTIFMLVAPVSVVPPIQQENSTKPATNTITIPLMRHLKIYGTLWGRVH
jgi:hypothetical protein